MQNNRQLLVDIGTFDIAYGILDYDKYYLDQFHVMNTQTPGNLLAKPTTLFMELLIEKLDSLSILENINDIIIKIPSSDQFLIFNTPNPTKEDLYVKLYEADIDIKDPTILIALHKKLIHPKTKNAIYPISIYDRSFKKFIEKLEIDKDAPIDHPNHGLYWRTVYFTTRIDSMKRAARNLSGLSAVIDSSYSKTSVLLSLDGEPFDYKEFEFSGKDLITVVNNKTNSELEAIKLVNKGAFTVDIEDYMNYQISLVKNYLYSNKVEKVILYGGLSNESIKLQKYLGIETLPPMELTSSIDTPEREMMAYRIRQLGLINKTDDIINPTNYTEFRENISDYEDITEDSFGTQLKREADPNRKAFIPNITKEDKEYLDNRKRESKEMFKTLHNKEGNKGQLRLFISTVTFSIVFILVLFFTGAINLNYATYITGIASADQKEFAIIVEENSKESIKNTANYLLMEDPDANKLKQFNSSVVDKNLRRPNPFKKSVVGSEMTITYTFSDIFFEKHGDLVINNLYKSFGYVLDKDNEWKPTNGFSEVMDISIKAFKINEFSANTFVQIKAICTKELRDVKTVDPKNI